MYDNREATGLCIVEEARWHKCDNHEEMAVGTQRYWIMYVEEDEWYPYGSHTNYHKALKKLEEMTNGQ